MPRTPRTYEKSHATSKGEKERGLAVSIRRLVEGVMRSKILVFFELIKFEHTVFALPFAYMSMILARKAWPGWQIFFWVTLAMVSARTAGMTLNRLIDRGIDAKNPRTKNRSIVTGEFPVVWAWVIAAVSLAVFFLSAAMLNPLCLKLSPVAIFLLTIYHYAKRFSRGCHFLLGLALSAAPMGGWLAVTGRFSWMPVVLALAVLFWVAGFDIIYSLQDMEFDKAQGLHSIPAGHGTKKALQISMICHGAAVAFWALFGFLNHLGALYAIGWAFAGAFLFWEHHLVSEDDLSRLQTAFFTLNGWVGIFLLIFTFLDIL